MELEVDALAKGDLDQPIHNLLVVLAQEHVAPVHKRHMSAELAEYSGKLVGDVAAARNHDPPGQGVEVEDLVGADCMLDAVQLGHQGSSARRDQDLVSGNFLAA